MGTRNKTSYVGLALFLLATVSCRTIKDKSGDPQFAPLVNKQYRTAQDLVIYRSENEKALSAGTYGQSDLPEKSEMKPQFPFNHYALVIEGVLPSGSEFKITKIQEESTVEASFIFYYAQVTSPATSKFHGQDINITFLADPTADPQFAIKKDVAVEK